VVQRRPRLDAGGQQLVSGIMQGAVKG
jgi:hypothetical protein